MAKKDEKIIRSRPKRPTYFEVGGIFHIFSRGVEKRKIAMDDRDRFRFVHDLFEFNDENPAPAPLDLSVSQLKKLLEVGLPRVSLRVVGERGPKAKQLPPRKKIVELLAWCLMPNHYHLMLRQCVEDGITLFMRKLGTGYTNYFNKRYKRVGHLFQGKFQAVQIVSEAHFLYLPYYIHFNPLDMRFPEWREGSVRNVNAALEYLSSYRWSSFPDYVGKKNFPSLLQEQQYVYQGRSPGTLFNEMHAWFGDRKSVFNFDKEESIFLD